MINVPVPVKDALKDGRLKKEYWIRFYNAEGTYQFEVKNDNLVSESVNIDERMCSGDELSFGLCEGSSIEFQYFNKPNSYGMTINVQLRTQYINTFGNVAWSSYIPMGFFEVKKCSRQASTGILKVTAYNKLQSDYLDAKANDLLIEAYENQDSYSPSTIEKILDIALQNYKIDSYVDVSINVHAENARGNLISTGVFGDIPIYDGDPPPPGSGILIEDFLHWFAPLVRVQFAHNKSNYSFYINMGGFVSKTEGLLGDYGSWRVPVDNGTLYHWFSEPGTSLSDVRAGAWTFNYTGTGSATDMVDYVGNYDVEYQSPYFYKINSKTDALSQTYEIGFYFPMVMVVDQTDTWSGSDWYNYFRDYEMDLKYEAQSIVRSSLKVHREKTSTGSNMPIDASIYDWPDVTLRELQSAIFEMDCQFGQLDRETDLFSGVELNHSRLYPAEDLYPATNLYPDGAAASATRAMYSKLWADEGNVHKWRYLIITYKGLNEDDQEEDFTLQRTINADGTDDYNMSDNWLFRNLVWTAEDVGTYADAMVPKMQDITWFPFEMWCAGLPYLETGDEIEIPLGDESYTSYILQRQLKGIQNLQDTYINGTLDIF